MAQPTCNRYYIFCLTFKGIPNKENTIEPNKEQGMQGLKKRKRRINNDNKA